MKIGCIDLSLSQLLCSSLSECLSITLIIFAVWPLLTSLRQDAPGEIFFFNPREEEEVVVVVVAAAIFVPIPLSIH